MRNFAAVVWKSFAGDLIHLSFFQYNGSNTVKNKTLCVKAHYLNFLRKPNLPNLTAGIAQLGLRP